MVLCFLAARSRSDFVAGVCYAQCFCNKKGCEVTGVTRDGDAASKLICGAKWRCLSEITIYYSQRVWAGPVNCSGSSPQRILLSL